MVGRVNENIMHGKQGDMLQDIRTLLKEQELVNSQSSRLSDTVGQMNGILSSRRDVDWQKLLNDIRNCMPRTARITELSGQASSGVSLKGEAVSYKDVYLFVDMLNESKQISSASLIKAEKYSKADGGLVGYAIDCSLTARKINSNVSR